MVTGHNIIQGVMMIDEKGTLGDPQNSPPINIDAIERTI